MKPGCNPRAIYWHTAYMLQKHYRRRWLTTHLDRLIYAAEMAGLTGNEDDLDSLLVAVEEAKRAVNTHGYRSTRTKAHNVPAPALTGQERGERD